MALAGDWEIARWLSALPHPYREQDARSWIAHVRADHAGGQPVSFAIALKDDDRVIGGGGLDGSRGAETEEAALGYWLGRPFWRQGYGREAVAAIVRYGLETLGLPSLRAYADPANLRSQSLLLACGFAPAGKIDLATPMHSGATRAPLFRIKR